MKTTKLFLSIALITLTAITFGMDKMADDILFENELDMEGWMATPFVEMEAELELESWMIMSFPLAEEALVMENWMASPFETEETVLALESWMTNPFYLGAETEILALESWMTAPFMATDDNCNIELMAAAGN